MANEDIALAALIRRCSIRAASPQKVGIDAFPWAETLLTTCRLWLWLIPGQLDGI